VAELAQDLGQEKLLVRRRWREHGHGAGF
jgi:hypothetical protein